MFKLNISAVTACLDSGKVGGGVGAVQRVGAVEADDAVLLGLPGSLPAGLPGRHGAAGGRGCRTAVPPLLQAADRNVRLHARSASSPVK